MRQADASKRRMDAGRNNRKEGAEDPDDCVFPVKRSKLMAILAKVKSNELIRFDTSGKSVLLVVVEQQQQLLLQNVI
jgi:hypothetical protein